MKKKRQQAIIELIAKQPVETQEELTSLLNDQGFSTTQATVSRDIRELELTKIPLPDGRQAYGLLSAREKEVAKSYQRILNDAIVSMETSGNLLVIKTASGMAMACAAALDDLDLPGLMGSIAGDDTIFCAVREQENGSDVIREIRLMMESTSDK